MIVGDDVSSSDGSSEDEGDDRSNKRRGGKRALVSAEGADLVATVSGSLGNCLVIINLYNHCVWLFTGYDQFLTLKALGV